MEESRISYESRWKLLLDPSSEGTLTFDDIPWPAFSLEPSTSLANTESFTAESVLTFLIPTTTNVPPIDQEAAAKFRKERLRETLLRFHPDKFEGRTLQRVRERDRERVREVAGRLVRVVNALMAGT